MLRSPPLRRPYLNTRINPNIEREKEEPGLFWETLLSYFENAELHGVKFITPPKGIFVKGIGAGFIIIRSDQHFSENPTVISVDKNYHDWKIPIPALTICIDDKVNPELEEEIIERIWKVGKNRNAKKYEYYSRYVQAVTNSSLHSLNAFAEFENDITLNKIAMYDLAFEVFNQTTISIQIGKNKKNISPVTLTEWGICYMFNSQISKYFAISAPGDEVDDFNGTYSYNETEVYTMYNNNDYITLTFGYEYSLRIFLHASNDLPEMTTRNSLFIPQYFKCTNYFSVGEHIASKDLRKLAPKQRGCRFPDELIKGVKFYSRNTCMMLCRAKQIIANCHCLPFFYSKLIQGQLGAEDCTAKGMFCVSKISFFVIRSCQNCLGSCENFYYDITNFVIERMMESVKESHVFPRIDIILEIFPNIRYIKNTLFTFQDLLVSYGGTVAFFLGCSIISGVEIIYYITIRLAAQLYRRFKTRQQQQQQQTNYNQNLDFYHYYYQM